MMALPINRVPALIAGIILCARALAQDIYTPGEDVVQKMTPRDARHTLRNTLGSVGVIWNDRDQFVAVKNTIYFRSMDLRGGPRGGWLLVWFVHVNPRVEQLPHRTILHLGTSHPSLRDQKLYYDGTKDLENARKMADALLVLKRAMERDFSPEADKSFEEVVQQFRTGEPKRQLPEAVRRLRVQAEAAVRDKDFTDAAELFGEVVRLAPWYAEAHFNYALLLGEAGEYWLAVHEMKRYLALVPEASNARAAQDRIYEWERKIDK